MKVTIVHTNLTTDGMIHVHRAGCADLKQYRSDHHLFTVDHASAEELVADFYSDIIDENPDTTWHTYYGEFHFLPCTSALPTTTTEETTTMTTTRTDALVDAVINGAVTFEEAVTGIATGKITLAPEPTRKATRAATRTAERRNNVVRFAEMLEVCNLEQIVPGFVINEDHTAEMFDTGRGWIVRAAGAADETGVLLDRWDAARVLRDWTTAADLIDA
jgi:hypothetical protein